LHEKKFTIFFILIFISLSISAQISKNSILLGGELGYRNSTIKYTSQPNQKYNQTILNISVGKAFSENSIYGFNLSYSPGSQSYFNGSEFDNSKVNNYGAGVFFRRYSKLAKDLYFFTEIGISYNYGKQKDVDTLNANIISVNQSTVQLYLTPGISYKIFKKFYFEIVIPDIFSLEYLQNKTISQGLTFNQHSFSIFSSVSSQSQYLEFLEVGFTLIL
jgi:hypothetical protein